MSDIEHTFARVTMDGTRFSGARLPVSSLVELARYQTLVLRAAEKVWADENPDSAIPEDFATGFELTLVEVEDGSATSVLERPVDAPYGEFYDSGRDELEREFEIALQPEPNIEDIPLLKYEDFSLFGSSLNTSEKIKILDPEEEMFVELTREISERVLQPLAQKYYEKHVGEPDITREDKTVRASIVGRLVALDAENENYRIKTEQYGTVLGKYKDEEIVSDLKAVLNSSSKAPLVRLDANLRFHGDRLFRILDVFNVQTLEVDGEPWSRRFIELASLEAGWHEESPDSAPIAFSALDGAREILLYIQECNLSIPGIFPIDDGSLNLEWASPTRVTSIEVDADLEFSIYETGRDRETIDIITSDINTVKKFISEVEL